MQPIDQLAETLIHRLESIRPIPIKHQLWSDRKVAEYLDVTPRQVKVYAKMPGFPDPMILPTDKGQKGKMRWKAVEIIKWGESL